MLCRINSKSSDKIAAFDLDYTLLKPKGRRKFPKNRDDAELMFDEIKNKIEELIEGGYKLVIFTNQRGIQRNKISESDIYYKIDKFVPHGKEFDVYIASKYDKYRKPSPAMFDVMMDKNDVEFEKMNDIFYVGDAAGRKGDFSSSDLNFAFNCAITFYTPEKFFLNSKEKIPIINLLNPPTPRGVFNIPDKCVVVMVGAPGSGKSVLSRSIGGVIVSNDVCGNSSKTMTQFKRALRDGEDVIIVDNTNPSVTQRARYLNLAKDNHYHTIIIYFDIDISIPQYLNWYRAYQDEKELIPEIAYRVYNKHFQKPNMSEANSIIEYVPNIPNYIFEFVF